MLTFYDLVISSPDIDQVTDLPSVLPFNIVSKEFSAGCYVAGAVTLNGDRIEMWIVEVAVPLLPASSRKVIILALNGLSNCYQYSPDDATRDLADWLRGRSFGCVAPQPSERRLLLPPANQLLAGLFADIAANESEAV